MKNNQYLSEKRYQRMRKKVKLFAALVLALGIIVGGSLITTGIIKSKEVEKKYNIENAKIKEKTRSKEDIQSEIDSLNNELITLKAQKNIEFRKNGFSEEYYRLENEINTKESKILNLTNEMNESLTKNTLDFDKEYEKSKSIPFYMFGAFIIIVSSMTSGLIYMSAYRRELLAYKVQQIIPVAQESIPIAQDAIEKMAPTSGFVAENIAKGITKGIKEGLKDNDNKE